MRLWGGDQGRSRGRPPARRGDVPLLGRRVVIRRSFLTAVDRIAFDIVPPGAWVMEATINLVFDAVVCAVVTVGRHMATSVTFSCRPSGRPATWGLHALTRCGPSCSRHWSRAGNRRRCRTLFQSCSGDHHRWTAKTRGLKSQENFHANNAPSNRNILPAYSHPA